MLHTHSFIYHRRCIMFFSPYFSFPLSVSFHHCSIPIFICEAWEPYNRSDAVLDIGQHHERKVLSLLCFSIHRVETCILQEGSVGWFRIQNYSAVPNNLQRTAGQLVWKDTIWTIKAPTTFSFSKWNCVFCCTDWFVVHLTMPQQINKGNNYYTASGEKWYNSD
jgi:hypothetical protein